MGWATNICGYHAHIFQIVSFRIPHFDIVDELLQAGQMCAERHPDGAEEISNCQ